MLRVGVLISGGGSNLQAILDSIDSRYLDCKVEAVISDRPGVFGLERAKGRGIEAFVLDRKVLKEKLSEEILKVFKDRVDLIVLAGFLSILKGDIIRAFRHRIINIHPSLIPAFCGDGMYGLKVHENAIESGVKVSGCTVHFVDELTDNGPIILQRTVPVYFEDTAETLQMRILEEEHTALPEAIKLISQEKVKVIGRRVLIND